MFSCNICLIIYTSPISTRPVVLNTLHLKKMFILFKVFFLLFDKVNLLAKNCDKL